MATPREVIDFWFDPRIEKLWFDRNEAFDAQIRERFANLIGQAAAGQLASWEATAIGALALVIALDQFPRNIHRESRLAFVADPQARAVAHRAIGPGFDVALPHSRRFFFYLPFERSEDAADQDRSVALFRAWVEACPHEKRAEAEYYLVHILRRQEIIQRFGRFPHRNAPPRPGDDVGRSSLPEGTALVVLR